MAPSSKIPIFLSALKSFFPQSEMGMLQTIQKNGAAWALKTSQRNYNLHYFDEAQDKKVLEIQALFRQFLQQHGIPIQAPLLLPNAKGLPQLTHACPGGHLWVCATLPGQTRPSPKPIALTLCAKWAQLLARSHQLSDFFPKRNKMSGLDASSEKKEGQTDSDEDMACPADQEIATMKLQHVLSLGEVLPDEICWIGDEISGITFQGFSKEIPITHDLAAALLRWCTDATGEIVSSHQEHFLSAYEQIRPLHAGEKEHLESAILAQASSWVPAPPSRQPHATPTRKNTQTSQRKSPQKNNKPKQAKRPGKSASKSKATAIKTKPTTAKKSIAKSSTKSRSAKSITTQKTAVKRAAKTQRKPTRQKHA